MIKPRLGTLVDSKELFNLFPSFEGSISMIYGRIRNGKTTEAVRRMLVALESGRVVYSNIPLNFDHIILDQRKSLFYLFRSLLFPWKKRFFEFDRNNYHYVDVDQFGTIEELIAFLSGLTDCLIVWDEGWYLLDSYEGTRFSKKKRALILHTGHFNRELIVISQRPSAIQTSARGNVSIFYKCQKIWSWPMILRVSEIQEMVNEMPDEDSVVRNRLYFAHKRYFQVFDTHFLRKGIPSSQEIKFRAYDIRLLDRVVLFFSLLFSALKRRKSKEVFTSTLQEKLPVQRTRFGDSGGG